MLVSGVQLRLDGRAHDDLADVDRIWLGDGEGDCLATACGGMAAASRRAVKAASSLGSRVLKDEIGVGEAWRHQRAAQALGSEFLPHHLAQCAYRGLRGGIDRLARDPFVGRCGRHSDEVPSALSTKDRQGGGNTVQDAARVRGVLGRNLMSTLRPSEGLGYVR